MHYYESKEGHVGRGVGDELDTGRLQQSTNLMFTFILAYYIWRGSGCVTRRSLATLEDQSSIPGAGNNNVLVTRGTVHIYILM